ncbi:MAG: M43 family zinc metalloprotease [Cytophagaceae bacterium]
MKNSTTLLFIIFFTLLIYPVFSQENYQRCYTQEYQQYLYEQNPGLKEKTEKFEKIIAEKARELKSMRMDEGNAFPEIFTIPVVVHIIHNNAEGTIGGAGNRNISDEQILSQIQVLNQDFRKIPETMGFNDHPVGADTKVEFCLATTDPQGNVTNGIRRVYSSRNSFGMEDDRLLSELSYWPSDQYLNIWVTNLSGNFLGYAKLPHGSGLNGLGSIDEGAEVDGVVINFRAFGALGTARAPYHFGRTTTHEVGHWLGLRHIWGDVRCGNDFVNDTPRHENANHNCTEKFSDCAETGIPIREMIENYMDYTNDECMNIFTIGQSNRMRIVLENSPRRAALRFSSGCCGGGERLAAPYFTSFENGNYTAEGWHSKSPVGNARNWELTNPGARNETSNSISFNNTSETAGNYYYFISPFLDFQAVSYPIMEFDLAYANNQSNQTDSLVVSYSTNCIDWTPLTMLSGQNLLSTQRITDDFFPQEHEWQKIRINLNHIQNRRIVFFRFENHSKGINRVYIDNFNIYRTAPELNVNFYPNPASGIVNAEVLFTGDRDVTFEVFNALGQKLKEWTDVNRISYIKQIIVEDLRRGMYIFRVSSGGETVVRKVIVQ